MINNEDIKIIRENHYALTRVVLTEKAPFWVEVFYDCDKKDYYGTYLVIACVSVEGTSNTIAGASIFDCYIIVEGNREGSFVIKKYCKRVKK